MKEIGIAGVILQMRRRKGATQDDLARFIGVSKASVSKWETGQSYPDITFLPRLASYFSITVDALLQYEPQMDGEAIRRLSQRLSADFTRLPFESVLAECKEVAHRYYSCYPLLFALGTLVLNHIAVADLAQMDAAVRECLALFLRVKAESDNARLVMQATEMEAVCYLALNEPEHALALLAPSFPPHQPVPVLLSAAHMLMENAEEAVSTLQAGLYDGLISMVDMLVALLSAYIEDARRFDQAAARLEALAGAFDLRALHPGMALNMLAILAIGYATQGRMPQALEAVCDYWRYAKASVDALSLHGDAFFDRIDGILAARGVETTPPRNPKVILRAVIDSIVSTPTFHALGGAPAFQQIRAEALAMKEDLL